MKKFTFLMLFAVMAIAANAVTVYYDNTNTKWDKVNAYAWKGSGTTTLGDWPGTQMTAVDGHDGWFQIDVKDAENVIFNNGSGTQTDDLTVDAAKPYYKNGGWADSFGGEVVPEETKYFLKHPFDGAGNWEWKEMTKQADGTYTLVANWNGVGANVHTQQNDEGAQWNPAELISGAPNATNVEVTYVYDPATGALNIVYTGEDIQITYYITGNAAFHTALGIEGEWNPALKVFENEVSFTAVAGTEYAFKFTDGSWTQTWGSAVVDAACGNVTTTTDDSGNIIFTLEADATVTITFDGKKACINKVDLSSALEEAVAGRVFAENGVLRAVLDQAALVEVFSLNGVLLDSQVSADYNVALGQGMYIVRINGKAQKVVLY